MELGPVALGGLLLSALFLAVFGPLRYSSAYLAATRSILELRLPDGGSADDFLVAFWALSAAVARPLALGGGIPDGPPVGLAWPDERSPAASIPKLRLGTLDRACAARFASWAPTLDFETCGE